MSEDQKEITISLPIGWYGSGQVKCYKVLCAICDMYEGMQGDLPDWTDDVRKARDRISWSLQSRATQIITELAEIPEELKFIPETEVKSSQQCKRCQRYDCPGC